MALINCPECGKEISDSSENCIHCGYPMNPQKKKKIPIKTIILILVIIGGIVGVIALLNGTKKSSTKREVCAVEGCENKVYTNGYCINHYGDDRAGKSTDLVSQSEEIIEEDDIDKLSITKNSKVTSNSCEFTFTGYKVASKIEPTNCKSSYYHYYEAASGNVYVDVKISAKNLTNTAVRQDSLFTKAQVIYDDQYEYDCFFVVVDKDGDLDGFTSLYSINPLETLEYHILAEVPKEVKDSNKSLKFDISVDGTVYECVLR